jgi:hypothetical protein
MKAPMKLTWFGGTTVRVHIGGAILVIDPDGAELGIDSTELVSGADQIIRSDGLSDIDLATWRPRKAGRSLDDEGLSPVRAWATESGGVLLDAAGEPPLLLFPYSEPHLGRWAGSAIIVINGTGESLATLGAAILGEMPPRLLILAGDDASIDHAIPILRDQLDGTGLVALEPRMALEV